MRVGGDGRGLYCPSWGQVCDLYDWRVSRCVYLLPRIGPRLLMAWCSSLSMLAWVCQDRQLVRQGLRAISDDADPVWSQQKDNMAIQGQDNASNRYYFTNI